MNTEHIGFYSVRTWSPNEDRSFHPDHGAGGGGARIQAKYMTDPEDFIFCDVPTYIVHTLTRDGHVIVETVAEWQHETPRERRAWSHRMGGSEGDHDDAKFCEVGWTAGANRNEKRWQQQALSV